MDFAYYPGLNKVEKALIAEYPKEALVVFQQMSLAEALTLKQFKRSAQNEESDAFRHFVWAGLLVKELDPELAQKFLDAHEAEPTSFVEERAMDLANNRAGILEVQRLKKIGKVTPEVIEQRAIEALKQNKLVVLRPRGGVP